jgi:hypothetical protein
MANKLNGELRLDLSNPGTAVDLAKILEDLDNQGIDRSEAVVTLQPAITHVGSLARDPFARSEAAPAGMQLVVTWDV